MFANQTACQLPRGTEAEGSVDTDLRACMGIVGEMSLLRASEGCDHDGYQQ